MALYIQKYGGSSVATIEQIKQIAAHIHKNIQQGHKVVAVVSAMGNSTDELIAQAKEVSTNPSLRELDMLLTVGERITMSLLSMALNDKGIRCKSLTGSQSGILTDDNHGNAKITKISGERIRQGLDESSVVIIAGFQGVCPESKEITTLGRGGTDLSAIALAQVLQADACQLYKDTGYILSADPRVVKNPKPIKKISWQSICEMSWAGAGVLHHRGANLAAKFQIPIEIRCNVNMDQIGTIIKGNKTMEQASVEAITSLDQLCLIELAYEELISKENFFSAFMQFLWKKGASPLVNQSFQHGEKHFIKAFIPMNLKDELEDLLHRLHGKSLNILDKNYQDQLGLISVIGSAFRQNPEEVEKMIQALPSPARWIEIHNSSVIIGVESSELSKCINKLYDSFPL